MSTDRERLDNLADAMIEDMLAMSDEDILAEFREDGGDPERHAAEMRARFETAVAKANGKERHMTTLDPTDATDQMWRVLYRAPREAAWRQYSASSDRRSAEESAAQVARWGYTTQVMAPVRAYDDLIVQVATLTARLAAAEGREATARQYTYPPGTYADLLQHHQYEMAERDATIMRAEGRIEAWAAENARLWRLLHHIRVRLVADRPGTYHRLLDAIDVALEPAAAPEPAVDECPADKKTDCDWCQAMSDCAYFEQTTRTRRIPGYVYTEVVDMWLCAVCAGPLRARLDALAATPDATGATNDGH